MKKKYKKKLRLEKFKESYTIRDNYKQEIYNILNDIFLDNSEKTKKLYIIFDNILNSEIDGPSLSITSDANDNILYNKLKNNKMLKNAVKILTRIMQ